jgi:predicted dithiol-disulfide oxidoreductase (DUF899 family)
MTRTGKESTMTDHEVVSREEWTAARDELLAREKEHTRLGDERARRRRELPWVRVEKEYRFDTDDGTRTLAELFDGRSQLLVYHFMYGPSYQAGCPTCSSIADTIDGVLPRLRAGGVTVMLMLQAPLGVLQAYKRRMGGAIPWVSAAGGDFNFDHGFSHTVEQTREWVEPIRDQLPPIAARNSRGTGTDLISYVSESWGFSAFVRAEGPRRGRGVAGVDPSPRRVRAAGMTAVKGGEHPRDHRAGRAGFLRS